MIAYYNENDPYAAEWLRNLIVTGHIAFGVVDERSIKDVSPADLAGFTQCHFFAGIGIWSYALRLAGWPDDRPVWTGSCPCQPFSNAGKRGGFDDERHLWPVWFDLIRQRRPGIVLGEQVASKDGYAWFDHVQADMEGLDYPCGAVVTPAAGFGAPHIRQRLYWVADSMSARWPQRWAGTGDGQTSGRCGVGGLAYANDTRSQGRGERGYGAGEWTARPSGVVGRLGHTESIEGRLSDRQGGKQNPESVGTGEARRANPLNGFWRDADWLLCRDGKWRPVEPMSQQMAHGITRGMVLLCTDQNITKRLNIVSETIGFRHEILRAMRNGYDPTTLWQSLGRCVGIPQATILLAFVCEQQRELGQFFDCKASRSSEIECRDMRTMQQISSENACSSQRWQLSEQRVIELRNALSELSQTSASFREIISELSAFNGMPLAHGTTARVGRLRAYGNAICAPQAAQFIECVIDFCHERSSL